MLVVVDGPGGSAGGELRARSRIARSVLESWWRCMLGGRGGSALGGTSRHQGMLRALQTRLPHLPRQRERDTLRLPPAHAAMQWHGPHAMHMPPPCSGRASHALSLCKSTTTWALPVMMLASTPDLSPLRPQHSRKSQPHRLGPPLNPAQAQAHTPLSPVPCDATQDGSLEGVCQTPSKITNYCTSATTRTLHHHPAHPPRPRCSAPFAPHDRPGSPTLFLLHALFRHTALQATPASPAPATPARPTHTRASLPLRHRPHSPMPCRHPPNGPAAGCCRRRSHRRPSWAPPEAAAMAT